MELNRFLLLNIDGADSEHSFDANELCLLYGATGSGKSTLLKGISRAARTSQGEMSPRGSERGHDFRSRCAALFECELGPLLKFNQLLDDAAHVRNLVQSEESLGLNVSFSDIFEDEPPVLELSENKEIEVDSVKKLVDVFSPYGYGFDPGRADPLKYFGGANRSLADWALVTWIFGSPEFRLRT